jgi:hypothetical protein
MPGKREARKPDGSGLAAVAAEGARAYGGRPMSALAKITPAAVIAAFAAAAQRLGDLCNLLAEGGLEMAEAAQGAVRFYAAMVGPEALRITCGIDMRAALRAVAMDIVKQDQGIVG